jgi:hypothetical protein
MIKKLLSFMKILLILIVIGVITIAFLTNADVRINIKNNTNITLKEITIISGGTILQVPNLYSKNTTNIVYKSKNEVDTLLIKYNDKSIEVHPYIEVDDSMVIYITINDPKKIQLKTKKLLFTMNIFEAFKNYWYKL